MAELVRWSGDGLGAGAFTTTSVGAGDTAPDLVTGAVTVDASGGRSPEIHYAQAAGSNAFARWTFAAQNQSAFRFYFTTPATWPSSTAGLFALTDSGGIGCRLSIAGSSSPGVLRVYENPTAAILDSTATNTLATSTKYRIEGVFDQAAGTLEVKLFLGESDTPLDTLSGVSVSGFGTSHTRMLVGNTNTTPTIATFYIDDIALDTGTTYISSPWVVPTPPGYDLTWTGDGLSAGAMTTASTGTGDTLISLVSGSTITVDASGPRSPRIRVAQDDSVNAYIRWAFTSRTQSSFLFYWTSPTAWPSAPGAIAMLTDASGIGCRISLASAASPGVLRLYENPTGSVLAQTHANQLSLNTLYRITGVFDQVAGTLTVTIHRGEEYEVFASLAASSAAFGAEHERFVLGNTNTTPTMAPMYFDDIYLKTGTDPIVSPYIDDPLPPPVYDVVWSGNGLSPQPFTVATYGPSETPADLVTGNVTVDTSGARSPRIMMAQQAGQGCNVRWSFAPRSQSAFRFYYTTPSSWASSSSTVALLRDASGVGIQIVMASSSSPGSLRLYEDPTAGILDSTPTNALLVSTTYRIEGVFDQVAGTLEVKIYRGESDIELVTLFAASANFGTQHERFILGNLTSTPTVGTMYFDDVALDAGTTYLSSPWVVPTVGPAFDVIWSGDGVAAGPMSTASVGNGDTLLNLVTGSEVTVDASGARSPRIKIAQADPSNAFVRWTFDSRTQSTFQFYWTSPPSWPSAPGAIAQITDASGIGCRISLASTTSPGRLRLYENPASAVLAQTQKNQLSLNTLYRIVGVFDQVAGTLTVNIHLGEAYETLATLTASSAAFGASHDRLIVGNTNTTPVMGTMYYDDIRLDTGTDLIVSPYVNDPLPPPLYDVVWNGDGLSAQAFTVATYGTGDTAPDQVNGSIWVDDSGARPPSIRMSQLVDEGCSVRWSFAARSQSSFRFYFTTPETWPNSTSSVAILTNSSNVGARIVMTGSSTPGTLRLYENPTASILDSTPKNTLHVSTRYRFEGVFDQIAGTFEVKVYLGDTDMLVNTLFATSSNFGSQHERFMIGNLNATPTVGTMYFDEIALDEGIAYLSTPYLTQYGADGDAWVKLGGDLFPVKVVAMKTSTGTEAIKRSYQVTGASDYVATYVSLNASTANGSGTATLAWTLSAGSDPHDGVYIGRTGLDSEGSGPWESSLLTGPCGLYTFSNLINGTSYLLYVEVVVGGVRTIRREVTVTPTGTIPVYGGTPGWTLLEDIDLSSQPAGTQYTNGVRGTDQSYNRPQNTTYGPSGMTITAARASVNDPIYASDVQMRGIVVPSQFAFEVDVTMTGLGAGRGPAVWFRPQSGNGELDLFEYLGAYVGDPYEMKTTVIRTGSNPYNQGGRDLPIPKSLMGNRFEGLHRWRYEFTATQAALWVDGNYVGAITKTAFESAFGVGSWSQFEGATQWYPRFTFQVNNGATASLWGFVPPDWLASTLHVSAARLYAKD